MKNPYILSLILTITLVSGCSKEERSKDNVRYQVLCNSCNVKYLMATGDTVNTIMENLWTFNMEAKNGTVCYLSATNRLNNGSVTVKIVSLPKEIVKEEEYGAGAFVTVEADWTVE